MKKKLLLGFLLIFCQAVFVMAQGRRITGRVISAEDKTPLPGVTVQIKNSSKGTQTDIEGNFAIEITNNNTTLVFSLVGTNSQEVKVGNQAEINVSLVADTKQLSEVVVTAIGIQREKKALGYAVSNIEAEQIQQRSESDLLRALNGKVPGLDIKAGGGAPGQSTRINIRGFSSFTGNTQPLFVVDGVPFDNSVDATDNFNSNTVYSNRAFDIDPNNIESMTILKGAAASALYGSRAANGVVIITTKSGSKRARKGLEITYNVGYSNEKISQTPDYQDKYSQGVNQNYNNGVIGNWGYPFANYVDEINRKYSTLYIPIDSVNNPLVVRYPELFAGVLPDRVKLQPYDILGQFFKTGYLLENSLNITSTGERTTLNATVSRMNNKGIVDNMNASRTSISLGGNAILNNKFTVSGSVTYVNTDQKSPLSGASFATDYGSGNEGSIYARLFYLPRNYDLMGLPFENPVDGSNIFYRASFDNPLWIVKYNHYSSNVNRAFAQMAVTYDPTSWLSLTMKGGVNGYGDFRKQNVRVGSSIIPQGNMYHDNRFNIEQDYNFVISVNKDINDKFLYRGMIGGNINERFKRYDYTFGQNFVVPDVYTLQNTQTQLGYSGSETKRILGVYTDMTFSYNEWLNFNFTARNDWSSTLPIANRSYFYPGASATFVFTDALELPRNILNFGKIRMAYGKVGRDTNPYLVNTTFNVPTAYTDYKGLKYNQLTTPDLLYNQQLKPEFLTEVEVGSELHFLNDRVVLDATYYHRSGTNLIITNAELPRSSGFTNAVINAGRLDNKGWEIGLNLIPVKLKNGLEWDIYTAFTRNRSLVVDAGPLGEVVLPSPVGGTVNTIHRTGYEYGQIFGIATAKDEKGNYLIDESQGWIINQPDAQIIGNPNPRFLLNVTNTIKWKGFNLSFLIDYRHGGQMYSVTAASLFLRGQLKIQEDREAIRVIPGVYGDPQTYKPILDEKGNTIKNTTGITAFNYHFSNGFGAYGADELNVYDITTIRLREVSLGYTIPKNILKRTPFGAARLSVSGRNLWYYVPNMLKGLNLDPEVLSATADSNVQGFDFGAAPSVRRLGANLSLSF
ncbi:MAG: SusC/RagA family TonB-linked outer membrane protein [Spirosomaceae bacterium]|nr:SusC/RagA family TonB-linked outer membrane protein [Spirosomataceae bacterium]